MRECRAADDFMLKMLFQHNARVGMDKENHGHEVILNGREFNLAPVDQRGCCSAEDPVRGLRIIVAGQIFPERMPQPINMLHVLSPINGVFGLLRVL
jgi:hypothetical protein